MKKNAWKLSRKVRFFRYLEELVLVNENKQSLYRFTPESVFFFDALKEPRTAAQLLPSDYPNRARAVRELESFCRRLAERNILEPHRAVSVALPAEVFWFPRTLGSLVGEFIAWLEPVTETQTMA